MSQNKKSTLKCRMGASNRLGLTGLTLLILAFVTAFVWFGEYSTYETSTLIVPAGSNQDAYYTTINSTIERVCKYYANKC